MNYDYTSIKSKIGVEFRRYGLSKEEISSFDNFYKKIEFFHQLGAIPFVIFYTDPDDILLPINNDDNLAKAITSARHINLYDRNYLKKSTSQSTAAASGTTTTTTQNNNNITSSNNTNNNNKNNKNNYNNGDNNQNLTTNINNNNNNNVITTTSSTSLQPVTIIRRPFLKLFVEKKGVFIQYYNGNFSGKYKKGQPFKGLSNLILSSNDHSLRPSIGMPEDFRKVSSIIDVDIVPETCRRVRIVKHGSDRPLGFYIRDGTYKRLNAQGQLEQVTGIFISRLVPGGLAESTGLLAVNDEVLEVNGIQVTHGKTLDQVTDMMVANSSNLIITIRPGKLNEYQ